MQEVGHQDVEAPLPVATEAGRPSVTRRQRIRPDPHNKQMRDMFRENTVMLREYIDFRKTLTTSMNESLKEMVSNQKKFLEIKERELQKKESKKGKGKKTQKRKHVSTDSDSSS